MTDKLYKKAVRSWSMYDWGNSAFVTTITAGFMPLYYAFMAENAGLTAQQATSSWAYLTTIAAIIISTTRREGVRSILANQIDSAEAYLDGAGTSEISDSAFRVNPDAPVLVVVAEILLNISLPDGSLRTESMNTHTDTGQYTFLLIHCHSGSWKKLQQW